MTDSDWKFHELSWTDPAGQLFWRGDELFRGIRPHRAALYRLLFEHGIVGRLVDKRLLIDTNVANFVTDEFPLILQHRRIPIITFASEWCEVSFKRATLLVLDMEIALREHDLTLIDINPWNILMEGAAPVYVDFGCISPLPDKSRWEASSQFEQFFLNPLLLYSKGLSRVARRMLYDPWTGVSTEDLARMKLSAGQSSPFVQRLAKTAKNKLPASLHPLAKSYRDKFFTAKSASNTWRNATDWILALRERIADMPLSGLTTRWAGYYNNNFPALDNPSEWTAKHHAIAGIIRDKRPRTLLDIGANRGWYSQLAAQEGVRAIATDSDETSINELCVDIEAKGLNVLPLFMDARFPEPARGPAYKLFPSAGTRLKSEMVLALAVIHHLVFTWHLSFAQVVENFAMFTEKWLVIEFVGPGDAVIQREWNAAERPWYTLEVLLAELRKYFDIQSQVVSDSGGLDYRGDDRTLIVCSKKV